MKFEASAGGVVVYKHANRCYVVLIKDAKGMWTFPKGKIEPKESIETAAQREIKEEVGIIDLTLINTLGSVEYVFKRKELVKKTVHYFLFRSRKKAKLTPQQEEGISQAKWYSFSQALKISGYRETNLSLLKQAMQNL